VTWVWAVVGLIVALALCLGIGMSRQAPPPRRPNVSRPVPDRSVPPSTPPLALRPVFRAQELAV